MPVGVLLAPVPTMALASIALAIVAARSARTIASIDGEAFSIVRRLNDVTLPTVLGARFTSSKVASVSESEPSSATHCAVPLPVCRGMSIGVPTRPSR
jgi:hypothetical protein